MPNTLYKYLADDHDRLDGLLKKAVANLPQVDTGAYEKFRRGLLRHISIEEKIAFPAVTRLRGGTPDPIMDRLRLDHSAIVALLVPTPSASVIATLLSILAVHNAREEETSGIYETLDALAEAESRSLLTQFHTAPEVPVHPTKPASQVIAATRRAVARAGYVFVEKED